MNTQPQPVENPKKTYTSPQLVNYGDVRTLTQAGASGLLENGTKNSNKRP